MINFFKKRKAPPRAARTAPGWRQALAGAALLPFLAAALCAAWGVLHGLGGRALNPWPALAGAGVYAALHALFPKPMTLYVFGHELTHALAALLSGHRVKSMSVSAKGGEVILSGSNLAVALAPYCVPLYALLTVATVEGLRHFTSVAVPDRGYAAALGVTFAFHVALTVHAIAQDQPDLRQGGTFLSLTLILLANTVVFALLLKLLFPAAVSLKVFAREFATTALLIWDRGLVWTGRGAVRASDAARAWWASRGDGTDWRHALPFLGGRP